MRCDLQGYQLNEFDKRRVEPLLSSIKEQGIAFKYFITLNYYKRNDDIARVLMDNRHLKKTIRSFFKSNIRLWFFTEKHLRDPKSNFYGSYHRHVLMEEIPDRVWKNPTNQMSKFMLELGPHMYFNYMWNNLPEESSRMELIKKVIIGLNPKSIPNGHRGKDFKEIYNLKGILSYCTKQNNRNIPHEYVIDLMNSSGLDDRWFRKNYSKHKSNLVAAH